MPGANVPLSSDHDRAEEGGQEPAPSELVFTALLEAGSIFLHVGSTNHPRCEERLIAQALPWPSDPASSDGLPTLFLLAPPAGDAIGNTTWTYWTLVFAATEVHVVGWTRVTVDRTNDPTRAAATGGVTTYRQPAVARIGIESRFGEMQLPPLDPPVVHWWFQREDCERALNFSSASVAPPARELGDSAREATFLARTTIARAGAELCTPSDEVPLVRAPRRWVDTARRGAGRRAAAGG